MFELRHKSAHLSDDRSAISPPELSLIFSEKEGSEATLIERITAVEGFTVEKARKKLSKYTDKVFNKLLNLNAVEIEGIGTLVRESDEMIRFEDTVAALTDEYQGLPQLALQPIKRMAETPPSDNTDDAPKSLNEKLASSMSESTAEPTPEYLQEPEEPKGGRPWWIPLIGGIILALAYLLFMQTCGAGDGSDGSFLDRFKSDTKEVVDETASTIGDAVDEGAAAIDEIVDIDNGTAEVDEATKTGADELDYSDDSAATDGDSSTSTQGTAAAGAEVPSTVQYSKGSSIIKSASGYASNCVIIVGSFTKPKNALKMMTKVENLGYKVYSSQYGQYTRVGLEFTCAESELDAYIAEARDVLEKQAWYLESPAK